MVCVHCTAPFRGNMIYSVSTWTCSKCVQEHINNTIPKNQDVACLHAKRRLSSNTKYIWLDPKMMEFDKFSFDSRILFLFWNNHVNAMTFCKTVEWRGDPRIVRVIQLERWRIYSICNLKWRLFKIYASFIYLFTCIL